MFPFFFCPFKSTIDFLKRPYQNVSYLDVLMYFLFVVNSIKRAWLVLDFSICGNSIL